MYRQVQLRGSLQNFYDRLCLRSLPVVQSIGGDDNKECDNSRMNSLRPNEMDVFAGQVIKKKKI